MTSEPTDQHQSTSMYKQMIKNVVDKPKDVLSDYANNINENYAHTKDNGLMQIFNSGEL